MKKDPKQLRLAKKLVELSMEGGEVSGDKVKEVLASLRQATVRDRPGTLRTFRRLLAREIALRTAVVESPLELAPEIIRELEENLSRQYGRNIRATVIRNQSLLAGLRVRVGDDLMDASLAGRLQNLAASVR